MSRPPNYEFQEWWNKQRAADQHSSSSTAGFLTLEIHSPSSTSSAATEKDRTRSARQLSWIYLRKLHRIAHSLAFVTNGFIYVIRTANRRIATAPSQQHSQQSKFYRIIKFFLLLSVILLLFELVAYFKGWHFSPPTLEPEDLVEYVYAKWLLIRANYLAPPLQSLTNVCIVLFMIQSVDRLVLVLGCCYIKLRGLRPTAEIDYENDDDDAQNVEDYPMVLVQIPMCNEREVRRSRFFKSLTENQVVKVVACLNRFPS